MKFNLNPEQQVAADHVTGPCVVTAVPGSGKTMTLTARVVNLITNHNVAPKNILCLTFTNKAAGEMRERSAKAIGQLSSEIWFSTFHSLCLAVLRKYGDKVGLSAGFSVYSEKEQRELMEKIARMHELHCKPNETYEMCRAVNDFREEIDDFEHAVREFDSTKRAIMAEYLTSLDDFNAVDFSGILYKTWKLFEKRPDAAENLHKRFKFVMIDETQDTNTIQYEIVRKIVDPGKTRKGNVFIVGDLNQSIFTWRGAKPENIMRIVDDFDDVKQVVLPRNYRSTPQILAAAEMLIRNNDDARDVNLIATRKDGSDVSVYQHPMPEEEARRVVMSIMEMRHRGYKYKDFAVLYRTNELSKIPEMWLRRYEIPYRIVGGFSFFDRREIKLALSYMSFMTNPMDTVSFSKIIECPRRGIGKTMVGRLERLCQQEKINMLEACRRIGEIKGATVVIQHAAAKFVGAFDKWRTEELRGLGAAKVAGGLLRDTGYLEFVEKDMPKDVNDGSKRMSNVDELLLGISEFEQSHGNAKVLDYLHTVQLMSSVDEAKEDDAVTLLTMHSAKGLEYPVVHIVGCEEKIIPHSMAVNEDRLDEERRLMYVAMTRAKDHLFINYCSGRKKFDKSRMQHYMVKCRPSPFLFEIGAVE